MICRLLNIQAIFSASRRRSSRWVLFPTFSISIFFLCATIFWFHPHDKLSYHDSAALTVAFPVPVVAQAQVGYMLENILSVRSAHRVVYTRFYLPLSFTVAFIHLSILSSFVCYWPVNLDYCTSIGLYFLHFGLIAGMSDYDGKSTLI